MPWQDDDEILAEIAAEAHRASVPDPVRSQALRAFAHRAAGGALAAVTYDSLRDVFLMRGHLPEGARILTFEADGLSVAVEIVGDRLTGQLVPPSPGGVELLTLDGVAGTATADELGRFLLAKPPAGPVRLRCEVADGIVLTDWFQIF